MSPGIDVLYVAWNRLEFTRASFGALVDNTNWELVRMLVIHDDGSTDGTREHLEAQAAYAQDILPCEVLLSRGRVGGPVATMNAYLEMEGRPPLFAKVDNDFVMPPHWLDDLAAVMEVNQELDILGCEPFVGLETAPPLEGQTWGSRLLEPEEGSEQYGTSAPVYGYTPARHIGGKGLIRARCFEGREMWADGYQGFTQWQERNEEVTKGWITPDLRCFGLDQLPLEPWRSLTDRYVAQGWQRRWSEYAEASHPYWDWWKCGITKCGNPATDYRVEVRAVGSEIGLRLCASHGELVSCGAVDGLSIGPDGIGDTL